jgi:hypothetical protein
MLPLRMLTDIACNSDDRMSLDKNLDDLFEFMDIDRVITEWPDETNYYKSMDTI